MSTINIYKEGKYFTSKVNVLDTKQIGEQMNSNSITMTGQKNLMMNWSGNRDSGTSFATPIPAKDINRYSWVPARTETPAIPEIPKGNSWFNANPTQVNGKRKFEKI
jgi:hypothetical protein